MNYSLDEAASLLSEKTGKAITRNQLLQLAIEGKITLCMLYDGMAHVYENDTDSIKEIYGWLDVPSRFLAGLLNNQHVAVNMLLGENIVCVLLEGVSKSLIATIDTVFVNEVRLDRLVRFNAIQPAGAPAAKVEAVPAPATIPASIKNKLRRNILDPAIDKAIKQAGSMELADVFLKLKELALNGELPFTGMIKGDALCYTDSNDNQETLTKNALGKRLKRR